MIRGLVTRFRSASQKLASHASLTAVILRYHIVRGHRVVLFEADWLGLYPFVRPLMMRLAHRPSIEIALVTRKSELRKIAEWMARDLPTRSRKGMVFSYETMAAVGLKPTMLISCQPYSRIATQLHGIPKIQLLHGIADKRGQLFGERKLSDFTHLFSPAPIVTELARERLVGDNVLEDSRLEIVEVGCPKTDDLFDGSYQRHTVLQDLGLPTDRPTVLYAPTWEKEASLEQHGEKILSVLAELEINLLVKPHPLSLADRKDPYLVKNGHGGKDWASILGGWQRRFQNLRWVRDPYANPYLVVADLLVSEGSGVAFEFVLLEKPVVFIDTPLVSARHGVDNLHHRLSACGTTAPSVGDLQPTVRRLLRAPEDGATDRQQLIRQLAYNLGRATDVAMNTIDRLLGESS